MNLEGVLGVDAASENVDGKPDSGAPTDPSVEVEGDVVTDTVPPCDGVSRRDPNEHDEIVFVKEVKNLKPRMARSPSVPTLYLEERTPSRDPSPPRGAEFYSIVLNAVERIALELDQLRKLGVVSDAAAKKARQRRRLSRKVAEALPEVD
mgnify:CR=1 FL=1